MIIIVRRLQYDIVWYADICCNGTLNFLPYHPLPSKKLKCSWDIWGSAV